MIRYEEEGDFLSHNCRCLRVCPHPHPPPPISKSSFSLRWRLGGREVREGLLFIEACPLREQNMSNFTTLLNISNV
jgi:hypothetical protein